ncbi:MAG: hypothetical protein KA140_02240 [Caldisericia bacterium]|nr:hypothetical protein [Caldisericia bacterium]
MKKISLLLCFSVLGLGFSSPAVEKPSISSLPSRLHFTANAYCSIGTMNIPAWDNEDYPLFDSIPRAKIGLVSFVPGTTMYGGGLAKLFNPQGFMDFIRYYSSNLHLLTIGEEYGFFSGGQEKTAGFVYSAMANAGVTPEQARKAIENNLISIKSDWTIPGTYRNYDSVRISANTSDLNLKKMMYDQQKCANGEVLANLSQTMIPASGWLEEPQNLEMTQPYTTVPVIHAQDQYLDFLMRPVGTVYDDNGKSSSTSDPVTWVRSKVSSVDVGNIKVSDGFDGIRNVDVDFGIRYKNEFRFQFEVDPPSLSGLTMVPTSPTELGVTTMYDKDGNIHKVQSAKVMENLYKWLPQSETAFAKEMFMVPAVRERVLEDRTYWSLSHFKLIYPQARFENGIRIVEQQSKIIEPIRFEDLSSQRFAYLNITNFPDFEEATGTAFIEKVDRPFRVVAVYEPAELAPRGSNVVVGSSRAKLMWNVTSEMKELARKKSQENGSSWWNGSFPTFYNIYVKGDANLKFERINPLDDSLIVDGLKPGGKYYWELETWVSDDWGSAGLSNTWKSDTFQTKSLPALVGKCVQTSAIKLETEIDSDDEENWVITVPTVYTLGNVKLKPLNFLVLDRTKDKLVPIQGFTGIKTFDEMENNKKVIKCKIKISKVPDTFQKNQSGQNVFYVEFQPLQIKVYGDCVDEYRKVIGSVSGTAGTWWPAADGDGLESPMRNVEAPLLIKGEKLWRFVRWNWVGSLVAARMPYVDGNRGVSILTVKASGCQPDPDKPLEPKLYAEYEEIPVDCFALGVGFTVNWKPVANKGQIPVSPKPDCPGDSNKYMAGTKVTVGPAPEVITIDGENYNFVGWVVGDQAYPGLKKITVTMDKGRSVYANYQPASGRFELVWYADIDGRNRKLDVKVFPAPDKDGLYPAGTQVRIGPVPLTLENGKYVLSGWAIDGKLDTSTATSSVLDLTMDSSHRVALVYVLSNK